LSSSAVASVSWAPCCEEAPERRESLLAWLRLSMLYIWSFRAWRTVVRSCLRFRSFSVMFELPEELRLCWRASILVPRIPSLRRAAAVIRDASELPSRCLVLRSWMLEMISSASCLASWKSCNQGSMSRRSPEGIASFFLLDSRCHLQEVTSSAKREECTQS